MTPIAESHRGACWGSQQVPMQSRSVQQPLIQLIEDGVADRDAERLRLVV